MNNPKIAVVVSCYNHQRFVKECLNSIFDQTYNNFFVHIFDNNSTDNSKIVITDFIKDNRPRHPDPSFMMLDGPLFTKGTLPIGVARWLMVQRIVRDCDWFAIIDADDQWDKDKLETQVKAIQNHPLAKLCFSDCYYLHWEDTRKKLEWPIMYEGEKESVGRKTFNEKYPPPDIENDYFDHLLCRNNFMACPTLMFHAGTFRELVPNPTHYTSAEDYDWILRFTLKYPAVWAKHPLAYYRIHKDQLTQKTPAFCTAEEIDVVKRISRIMNPEKYNRLKNRIRKHLVWLYFKLIYKEIRNG